MHRLISGKQNSKSHLLAVAEEGVIQLTLRNLAIMVGCVLLLALGSVSAVMATNNPPGNGKDPCSHGNANKQCKDDPQPDKGKDCEEHGKGGKNEDHCDPRDTTTTPTTTTPTTTIPTTPTPTTPTSTTPTSTNPTTTTPSPTTDPPLCRPTTRDVIQIVTVPGKTVVKTKIVYRNKMRTKIIYRTKTITKIRTMKVYMRPYKGKWYPVVPAKG